jgi:hypothetical protein
MKMSIGTSFPMVKMLLAIAACRTPTTFSTVSASTTPIMITARIQPALAGAQKSDR